MKKELIDHLSNELEIERKKFDGIDFESIESIYDVIEEAGGL